MYYNTTLNTVRICTQSSPSVVWSGLGGGANQQLSNLSAVAVNSDLLPQASDTINLGNSSFPWATIYAVDAYFELGAIHTDNTNGGTLWLNYLNGNDGHESINFSAGEITATADTGLILSGFSNTVSGTLRILQASTDGTNYIGLTVSPTLGATTTYTLPSDGTSGYLLSTNGSGVLSWVPAPVTGANQHLSNLLSPTAVNQDILPATSNTYQLGYLSQAWYGIASYGLASPAALNIQSGGGGTITINPSGGTIQPEGNIVPNAATYNLGSQTDYWAAVYASLIKDSVNVTSIDVINREMKDSLGIESIDYGGRALWAQLGPTQVMTWSTTGVTMNIAMLLNGSTSGAITQQAAATTTSYSITWPAAQASGTQILQNNGSGVLSWVTAGSSGANTALSNLVTTSINQSLLPNASNTLSLGSSSLYWAASYIEGLVDGNGYNVVNPITHQLMDNSNVLSLSWSGRSLRDSSGTFSVDWGGRELFDSSLKVGVNWQNRQLIGTDGSTVLADWAGTTTVNIHKSLTYEGSTSGTLSLQAAATTTSYSLTWPAAQASGTQYLQNNGSGVLSWASVSSGAPTVQYYTVTGTDITNGYMTLSGTPASPTSTLLDVIGGTAQAYTTDFTVSGAQLTWAGTLASSIASGDVLRIAFW
jgi:hypothetical protein